VLQQPSRKKPVSGATEQGSSVPPSTLRAFGVGAYFSKDKVTIAGAFKEFTRPGGDGRMMHNRFCPECGSNLFWESELLPGAFGIAVGSFTDPGFTPPARSVWEENKHAWVQLGPEIPGHVQGRASKASR
jgi:hypothetical protein